MEIGKDKFLHFGACLIATVIVGFAMSFIGKWQSIACGVFFSFGLGIGKETGDAMAVGNRWDWLDIVADFGGTVTGVMTLLIGWCLV